MIGLNRIIRILLHDMARREQQLGLLHRGKTSFGMLKRMRRICRVRPVLPPRSVFAGFRFPREVIVLAVRWYLRYGLSYRDVEELLAERGVRLTTSRSPGRCSASPRC
jgi:hypothetical protein